MTLCTFQTTAAPSTKRRKVQGAKKGKAERVMDKAVDSFLKFQAVAEEKFYKHEQQQWEKEKELEEKRRREDREHEIFMMQLLGLMLQKDSHHSRPDTQPFDDDF